MVDEARYGDSVAAEVGEYNVTAGLEAYWWMMATCNSVELVDLNEDGLDDFKGMLLSLGYPLLTENVVDHIIYKFTRSDYVSHKHRGERTAYFSNKTFALDNPNEWCARSAVEELDDDGEQSGAGEAAPEAATRGRAADGAMTPDATLNPEAEPPLTTKSDPSGEDSAEPPPAADLELSRAAEAAEDEDANEDAAIGEAGEAGTSAPRVAMRADAPDAPPVGEALGEAAISEAEAAVGELKLSRATEAAKDEDATEDAAIGTAAVTGPACDQATACEPADHREPDYPEPDHTELDYSLTTDPISGKPIEPGARLVMKLNAELDTEKARHAGEFLHPEVYGSVYGVGTSGGGTSGGGTSGAWEDDDADGAASKKKKSRLEGDGAAAQDSADDVEV